MINGKSAPRGKSNKPELLRKYKITNKLIYKWFRYNSVESFNASSAKSDMINGINKLIQHIEQLNKENIHDYNL